MSDLPKVRRLEAVGFRAWPAAVVQYDGSWLCRLTAGHPSRRLNSINPLDPSDIRDIAIRLEKAAKRFSDYGRPLLVRQTPLTPPKLVAFMDEAGWDHIGETAVMMADLATLPRDEVVEHLPTRDVGRFVDARLAVTGDDAGLKPGLTEIINAIRPETGLFIFEEPGHGPTAVALVVQDNDLAGILQMGVAPSHRRKGIGAAILNAALRWARLRGARHAWLQVEACNTAALALYRRAGFHEIYRYSYRGPDAR
ncbi:GNAT family N-acetyltransferase [Shinella daejeonensis]|uniref:GNAT family N-acetyltransferase n=1 Tax=Shinella daejeonensis TaxID=659017 RepID=UPI0020C7C6B7|nr:GNAT family N-acetyltransferase [Shinella daejeonensis]MCP8896011.1 GNAT family N-acetyltransferase [Shinella daejeonensis]